MEVLPKNLKFLKMFSYTSSLMESNIIGSNIIIIKKFEK